MNPRLAVLAEAARYACDLAAFAVPAIAYVSSASHQPGSWDTAELQGVPFILGIAHPTGFPLYVLLGYAWSHAFAIDSVAFRMNAMSALAIAGACGIAYAIARELGARRFVALPATLWCAFVVDVWQHATRAESQDLAVLLEVAALYAFVRWMKGGTWRWYAGAFALLGLAIAAHPNALLMLAALIAGSIAVKRRPPLRLVWGCAGLMIAALALYLYLPLRSAWIVSHGMDPTLGLPGTSGALFLNYNNPSTPHGLVLEIFGGASGAPHDFLASLNPARIPAAFVALARGIAEQFSPVMLGLWAAGLYFAARRDWRIALTLFVASIATLLFSVTYADEIDLGRYQMTALLLAVPFVASIEIASGRLRTAASIALALVLAIGAGRAFGAHPEYFIHEPFEGGRWVIASVEPLVPPGSIVLSSWLDATSLAYGAYVDGTLAGRIVLSGYPDENVRFYPLWARTRPVYVLAPGQDVLPNATIVAHLDAYHTLWLAKPAP